VTLSIPFALRHQSIPSHHAIFIWFHFWFVLHFFPVIFSVFLHNHLG